MDQKKQSLTGRYKLSAEDQPQPESNFEKQMRIAREL